MAGLTPGDAVLRMRGVEKRFGAVTALAGVDLDVGSGEVHALIGENGAGKSTLMKVLSGVHAPDAGTVELFGESFRPRSPRHSLDRGVAMIYQELNLAPELTVEQNVMLGREPRRLGVVRRGEMRRMVSEALEVLAHPEIRPGRRVAELGPGARQLVEVARALVGDARVIVMDEPTSSLPHDDAMHLGELVGRLAARGVSVIYISHFLEEVKRVAHRYTVLRDGATVAEGNVRDVAIAELVEAMVGRSLDEVFPRVPHEPGEVVLELDALAGERLPREASLALRRGEILGVFGLVGAGRTEMLRALFGLAPLRDGTVRLGGVAIGEGSPRDRLGRGIGLLSEDRKDEGLALAMSIADNVTLSRPEPFSRLGWIDRRARDALAAKQLDALAVRYRDPSQRVGQLSGGNQQKVALARLLHHDVDVLLLDEPTRGIDVGSKVEVYRLVGEQAARGKAVLFVSSYVPELLGVCDRVAVMHRGRLGETRPASEWTEAAIMDEATRGRVVA